MIEIELLKVRTDRTHTGYRLTAKGHANAGEYGRDIVCAAVSCLVQTLADKAEECGRHSVTNSCVQHEDGVMSIRLDPDDVMQETVAAWMEFVQDGLCAISAEYPEYVQVTECILDGDEEMPQMPKAKTGDGGCGCNLQLFAEGGAEGGAAAGAEGAAAGGETMAPAMTPAQERLARRSGALKTKSARAAEPAAAAENPAEPEENAGTGEENETPDAGESGKQETEPTPEQRRRAFGEMMQGEYRDLFDEMMQRAVDEATRRIEENPQMNALREALREAYGTDVDDMDGLIDAVKNGRVKNEAYYEELAQQRGVSVKTAKELDQIESQLRRANAENERQQRMQQEMQRQQRVADIRAQWEQQAEQLRAQYPDFVLEEVLDNPQIGNLMRRGVSLPDAYRAVYFDHILAQSTERTAQQVERGVSERIRQRNARPSENGTNPGGAAVTKVDVANMTKRQREELARRAARGERIVL